jgi:hypothetical protein
LDHLDPSDLAQHGLALERNLDDITTYSVGQVRRDDLTGTYCGTQRATPDNAGATVYGGSDLLVVRGDYGAGHAAHAVKFAPARDFCSQGREQACALIVVPVG